MNINILALDFINNKTRISMRAHSCMCGLCNASRFCCCCWLLLRLLSLLLLIVLCMLCVCGIHVDVCMSRQYKIMSYAIYSWLQFDAFNSIQFNSFRLKETKRQKKICLLSSIRFMFIYIYSKVHMLASVSVCVCECSGLDYFLYCFAYYAMLLFN